VERRGVEHRHLAVTSCRRGRLSRSSRGLLGRACSPRSKPRLRGGSITYPLPLAPASCGTS
jgi:hypothetical protein